MTKKRLTTEYWLRLFRSGGKFYRMADLMKLTGHNYPACRMAASRLVKMGLLIRIGKELFGNSLLGFSPEEAACTAYAPSYLSCEYVLSRVGVIDQMPVVITAVTLNRGKRMRVGGTTVEYRHLRRGLFWGYVVERESFIAEPEKALLDWIYFSIRKNDRLALDEINWENIERSKFEEYAARFPRQVRRQLGK